MAVQYHWDLIQGTDDWLRVRHGMLTASEMKNFITAAKMQVANHKETRAHIYQLAYERVTGYLDPYFESWDMQRGKIEEVYAKDLYSKHYEQVRDCGFITNDKLGFMVGFSPDGLVGENGLIECKSRKGNLQFQTIVDNVAPVDFNVQVQTGLWVSERDWCDFLSYGNGMPMFKERCYAEDKAQNAVTEAARIAEEKILETIETYKKVVEERGLITAPRRDPEDGTEIKPSHRYDRDQADYLIEG